MVNLDSWKKDWRRVSEFFDATEQNTLRERLSQFTPANAVYVSWEGPHAKSGGLGAVASTIMPSLDNVVSAKALLLTPYHTNVIPDEEVTGEKKDIHVPFGRNNTIDAQVIIDPSGVVYLQADSFFEAKNTINDPYMYSDKGDLLKRDALFFSKAVPYVLEAMGVKNNIVLHLNEWQTTTVALTAKEAMLEGRLNSAGTVQTIHNPFDQSLSTEDVQLLLSPSRWEKEVLGKSVEGNVKDLESRGMLTAYILGLGLIDAPITTVSENFAKEFTQDPLQTNHFAPHLQTYFERGVIGVNNGPFVEFSSFFPGRENTSLDQLKKTKLEQRKKLLDILDNYVPDERFGNLTYKGSSITNLPDNIPIFLMSGRLDPNQKGYDIFLKAIESFGKDEIKVVLTPMPVDNEDLSYFHEVASKCDGNVTVFPIRMAKGFVELQTGSTYGVMPSTYEPFGAAIEYMVNGTGVLARKTGGLPDQVEHEKSGLLFLEDKGSKTPQSMDEFFHWSGIVQARKQNLWAQNMVHSLQMEMRDAVELYKNRTDAYHTMIQQGFAAAKKFSWEKAANEYIQVYQKIRSR